MQISIVSFVLTVVFITGVSVGAQAAKMKLQPAGEDPNVKRESCCAQFGGRWDPSVNPGYCRGLRGGNMAINFNNCVNGT